jgi:two-component system alkaline phosphatase synthesis response regulator PhoP
MAKKILIADDEEDVKAVVQLFLESKGYLTVTAFDGLDAIERAKEEHPDLIILDIMMPIIDGFEVCKKLKADPSLAKIPVIMLSASSHSESKQRGLEAGAVDYLIKPFEPEQLERVIKNILA